MGPPALTALPAVRQPYGQRGWGGGCYIMSGSGERLPFPKALETSGLSRYRPRPSGSKSFCGCPRGRAAQRFSRTAGDSEHPVVRAPPLFDHRPCTMVLLWCGFPFGGSFSSSFPIGRTSTTDRAQGASVRRLPNVFAGVWPSLYDLLFAGAFQLQRPETSVPFGRSASPHVTVAFRNPHTLEKSFFGSCHSTPPPTQRKGRCLGRSLIAPFFCGFRALRPPAALQTVGARDAVCPGGRDPRLRQNPLWGPLLERFARPRAGRCATSGATGLGRPHLLFKLLPVSSIKRSS